MRVVSIRSSKIVYEGSTYQVGERVQFLAHKTGLLPPPRDLAVHEVKEQAEWHKAKRPVEVRVVVRVILDAVAQRGEDRHYTAEA